GQILVAGTKSISYYGDAMVARYNADGTLDTAFGSSGVALSGGYYSSGFSDLAVQSDGKIVAVVSSTYAVEVVRFTANGALDTAFGSHGEASAGSGYSTTGLAGAIQKTGGLIAL